LSFKNGLSENLSERTLMTTSNYINTLKGVLIFLTLFLLTAPLYGEIGISSKYLEVVMDNASGRFYVKTLIGDPDNPNDDKKILLLTEYHLQATLPFSLITRDLK
jgi:hypothetical protein